MNNARPILQVEHLTKYFDAAHGKKVHAVEDVSFTLARGETLGIVGESGCGKSSMGRTILKIHDSTGGKIIFDGTDITKLTNRQMHPYRRRMQMIFQDPYASLDPRMTVGEIIEEPMVIHKMGTSSERRAIVQELIQTVGLKPDHIRRYPFEFSGGQRQRIGIARAFVINPEFVICDEPVSALDVSIQAQILNLFKELQRERNTTYLFISHDMSVIKHVSDRIAVMYLGSIVELAEKRDLFTNTLHPYTKALINAIPIPNPKIKSEMKTLEGELPSPLNPPSGCPFRLRCDKAMKCCEIEKPALIEAETGHFVACHRYKEASK